jgi:transcriptional regulator with XRE-family HTH domain
MKNRIKILRERRGLSQETVAERMGTIRGQVSKLEQGKARLNDIWMDKLSKALSCDPGELVSDAIQHQIPIIGEVPGGDLMAAIDAAPDGFVQFNSARQNLRALRVRGNSMSRLAPDGMYVVVDFDDNNPAQLNNQPVIVCIECPTTNDHECSFKIYKRNPDRFEPYSIEAGYDVIFPQGRSWKIYGRVIGVVGYVGCENDEAKLLTRAAA